MEKKSRFELIKLVEAQKEQQNRYETRLRDVVRAYKNLLQEKEALEATVKVLTSGNTQPTKSSQRNEPSHSRDQKEVVKDEISSDKASKSGGLASPLEEDGFKKGEVLDHPLAVKDDEGNDESQLPSDKEDNSSEHGELETLREKIVTLTTSLATVMEQKSKMEASYQADKKKMMPLTADSPDLTKAPTNLTKGASSVKIGDDQSQWQAFSNTGYQGTPVYLQPGNSYPSLKSMELTSPIKSMRASPSH